MEDRPYKFRQGDIVRVRPLNTVGQVADIDGGIVSYPYYVDLPNHPFVADWFAEDDLEPAGIGQSSGS
jgi:hypothetical protein